MASISQMEKLETEADQLKATGSWWQSRSEVIKTENRNRAAAECLYRGSEVRTLPRKQPGITLVLWFSAFSPSYRALLKDISPRICSAVTSLSNQKGEGEGGNNMCQTWTYCFCTAFTIFTLNVCLLQYSLAQLMASVTKVTQARNLVIPQLLFPYPLPHVTPSLTAPSQFLTVLPFLSFFCTCPFFSISIATSQFISHHCKTFNQTIIPTFE